MSPLTKILWTFLQSRCQTPPRPFTFTFQAMAFYIHSVALESVYTNIPHTHTHTHTHPFNGSLSRTTRVSWYQKGKTNLDFTFLVQAHPGTAGKRAVKRVCV